MILSHFSRTELQLIPDFPYMQNNRHNAKPHGLWLSDESDYDNGWKAFCKRKGFSWVRLDFEAQFTIKDEANILHLKTRSDVFDFAKEYGVVPDWTGGLRNPDYFSGPDWERVAREYDGILITPYLPTDGFRHSMSWYDAWDVSSGCFWNTDILERVSQVSHVL